jgi:hypothetical protein
MTTTTTKPTITLKTARREVAGLLKGGGSIAKAAQIVYDAYNVERERGEPGALIKSPESLAACYSAWKNRNNKKRRKNVKSKQRSEKKAPETVPQESPVKPELTLENIAKVALLSAIPAKIRLDIITKILKM